ncbi:NADH dehydrogenase [Bacteroidia bacterium]|nr:NADH dehydrogenase [Bacteroidia bacterium]
MEKMVNIPEKAGKKRVVIVGAGFGGLKLAGKLNPEYFDVILLDKNNYHQFQPLFYQVAIAGLEPSSIAYPLRKNFQKKHHVHFRMCEVIGVFPENQSVETNEGSVDYDYLVIATGCDTNFFGNQSLKNTTITLKSVSEALYARNRILQSFEDAASTNNEELLKKRLTFVIVGGGATGVELAGALADMRNHILPKDYPEIDFSKMQIHLVDASPRLLLAMSEEASVKATETLEDRGVKIYQNVFVTSYEDGVVSISDGTRLVSDNVLWVAGIVGDKLSGFSQDSYTKSNRLIVNRYCEVKGFNDIFAIGDIAYMETEAYPKGHPQVAQGALQMAVNLATNLELKEFGHNPSPFKYVDKGSMATIGRNAAVADIIHFHFSGAPAWWLWLVVHLYTIMGIKNKLFIFLDWAWSYFTYDISLRLLIRPKTKMN